VKVTRYAKFIAQVFFTGVSMLVAALVDNRVDAGEWINVFVAMLRTVSVLGAGELPEGVWRWMKTYVSAATAAAVLAISYVTDGWYITTTEWLQIALAAAAALGVTFLPGPKVYTAEAYGKHSAGLREGPP
jgi:hypothetical protein